MIRSFINSAEPVNKQVYSLLNHFQAKVPNKILIDHAIKLHNYSRIKGLGLIANEKIPAKDRILSISATQAFTGLEIVDADPKATKKLSDVAEKIATKYHENNQSQFYNTVNILKIIFQIIVQQNDPNLSLHQYANFLYENSPSHVPLNYSNFYEQYIFSSHLKELIEAQKTYLIAVTEDLTQNRLPFIKYEDVLKSVGIIRSRSLNFTPHEPKKFTKDTFLILCPIADLVNHSFTPNCQVEGSFNYFENDSFIEIRALQDIDQGEEITINYGDLSNYDYLMKYGFLNDNNPFDEYYLTLDFGNVVEYTSQLFDLKHKILSLIPDLKLENIKIFKDRIDTNVLASLRIYFLTEEDLKSNPEINNYLPRDFKVKINDAHEKRIFEFIIQNITQELEKLSKMRNQVLNSVSLANNVNQDAFYDIKVLRANRERINDDILCNIIQIGLEEENTLKKNLDFCNNQLKSLSK